MDRAVLRDFAINGDSFFGVLLGERDSRFRGVGDKEDAALFGDLGEEEERPVLSKRDWSSITWTQRAAGWEAAVLATLAEISAKLRLGVLMGVTEAGTRTGTQWTGEVDVPGRLSPLKQVGRVALRLNAWLINSSAESNTNLEAILNRYKRVNQVIKSNVELFVLGKLNDN